LAYRALPDPEEEHHEYKIPNHGTQSRVELARFLIVHSWSTLDHQFTFMGFFFDPVLDASRNPAPVSPPISRLMPSQTILATHYALDGYKRGSHCVWPASLCNLQNLANELRAFV
jgi:hypothetical protein